MITSVFAVHVFLCEVGAFVLKINAVHGEKFREDAGFHLFHQLIRAVAIDESAFS